VFPERAIRELTKEIIDEFMLPETTCANFIAERMSWALAIGFDLGRSQSSKHKPIARLDENGRIDKVYGNMHAAARDNRVAVQNISRAVNKNKTSAGYHWKLVDPNDHYVYRKIK
jgi:hypothetical protein